MHKRSQRLAAAALLLLSGVSAQACDIWRDEDLGIWRGNCFFKDKFQLSHTFLANYESRLILKWPDLHVRKFKFFVSGTSIDIQADIENIGQANAPASTFFVDATFGNPLTMMQQGASMQWTVNVPALAMNTSQRVSVATVTVPNNMQDWDLVLVGTVDPPTMAQPVRGLIIESDETNNVKNHACRWYGPNPDTSLQACN
ncbi:MAG TPA: CARDB domain-containing protein [Steroidobacteraceae bacterium]|nr:CARDB domain-containing protein [Steroidobacteraceae bacterium]